MFRSNRLREDTRPLIVVCGAAGKQGTSVIDFLNADQTWRVRGLTRDPTRPEAIELADRGVEVVRADFDEPESLLDAFRGAWGVFGMTDWFSAPDREARQGKTIVDAAVQAGVQYFVWSSAEHHESRVPYLESKAEVADYLATTSLRWTTVLPCFFYSNLFLMGIIKQSDGSVKINLPWPTDACIPMLDSADVGAYVFTAFKDPDSWHGKEIAIAAEYITPRQIAATYKEISGLSVQLQEMTEEQFFAYDKDAFPFGSAVWLNMKLFLEQGDKGRRSVDLARRLYPELTSWREYVKLYCYEPPAHRLHVYMTTQEIVFCDYDEGWVYTGDDTGGEHHSSATGEDMKSFDSLREMARLRLVEISRNSKGSRSVTPVTPH